MNILAKLSNLSPSKAAPIKNKRFIFPNKREALFLFPSQTDKPEDIIKALELAPYKAVFLNLGHAQGFDNSQLPKLIQLFSRGIASAAIEADALIIDGGAPSGVMALMGKGVADRGYKSMLLGISTADQVILQDDTINNAFLEPNHTHFILTEGSNLESQPLVNELITQLIKKPVVSNKKIIERKVPAIAIVTGGNEATQAMVLQAVRQQLTILIIQGTGGLADEIATAWQKKEKVPQDPSMAEIIADGKFLFHSLNSPAADIQGLVSSGLGFDKVLMQAWETFADYDLNAKNQQKRFDQIQQAIIIIGVAGTFLAILKELMRSDEEPGLFLRFSFHLLILIPITLTILITIANRFKQGNKWLLLRAAAESIEREIFRYRTRTNDCLVNPEQLLSKRIEDITTRTMRTEVNSSYLKPYNKDLGFPPDMYGARGGDDGFSLISPERYITIRLADQLSYFKQRSVRLGSQLNIFLIITFVVGGIGTYLAATNNTLWIALTTTIIAAVGTYLGYRQTENSLTKYNQTATNLENVKAWWNSLPVKDQSLQENKNSLVEHTEQVLQVELDGWIQQMQNALAELRRNQESKQESNENKPAAEKVRPVNNTEEPVQPAETPSEGPKAESGEVQVQEEDEQEEISSEPMVKQIHLEKPRPGSRLRSTIIETPDVHVVKNNMETNNENDSTVYRQVTLPGFDGNK